MPALLAVASFCSSALLPQLELQLYCSRVKSLLCASAQLQHDFVVSGLYPFNNITFGTCGATGRQGPSSSTTCAASYSQYGSWAEDSGKLIIVHGIQIWEVPQTGNYRCANVTGCHAVGACRAFCRVQKFPMTEALSAACTHHVRCPALLKVAMHCIFYQSQCHHGKRYNTLSVPVFAVSALPVPAAAWALAALVASQRLYLAASSSVLALTSSF